MRVRSFSFFSFIFYQLNVVFLIARHKHFVGNINIIIFIKKIFINFFDGFYVEKAMCFCGSNKREEKMILNKFCKTVKSAYMFGCIIPPNNDDNAYNKF